MVLKGSVCAQLKINVSRKKRGFKIETWTTNLLEQRTCLQLEEGVAVGAVNELIIALATFERNACEVRVSLLAVLTDNNCVVVRVLLQEVLRVVVCVDEDLAHRVVNLGVGGTLSDEQLQEGGQQLQAVTFLDFLAEGCHR